MKEEEGIEGASGWGDPATPLPGVTGGAPGVRGEGVGRGAPDEVERSGVGKEGSRLEKKSVSTLKGSS